MATFGKSVLINRPQQEVFDFVSDPTKNVEWQSIAQSAEWTSKGPIGVGSALRAVDKFLGRKFESTAEVTIWDPPNRMTLKSVSGPFSFEIGFELESKENGTQLTMNTTAEFRGFFKVAEGLVARQAQKQIDTDLEALKLLLEAG